MKTFGKKGSMKNWRIQKGNEVTWFKGHKKGTGIVVRVVSHENKDLGFKSVFENAYEVQDHITGDKLIFTAKDLARKE